MDVLCTEKLHMVAEECNTHFRTVMQGYVFAGFSLVPDSWKQLRKCGDASLRGGVECYVTFFLLIFSPPYFSLLIMLYIYLCFSGRYALGSSYLKSVLSKAINRVLRYRRDGDDPAPQ